MSSRCTSLLETKPISFTVYTIFHFSLWKYVRWRCRVLIGILRTTLKPLYRIEGKHRVHHLILRSGWKRCHPRRLYGTYFNDVPDDWSSRNIESGDRFFQTSLEDDVIATKWFGTTRRLCRNRTFNFARAINGWQSQRNLRSSIESRHGIQDLQVDISRRPHVLQWK